MNVLLHMRALLVVMALAAFGLSACQPNPDGPTVPVDRRVVTVCPATEADVAPPMGTEIGCRALTAWEVDPQGTHLWALYTLHISEDGVGSQPALTVAAKASVEAFVNGQRVGSNGRPGDKAQTESAGQMDWSVRLSAESLEPGRNEIALRMSSHRGWLDLRMPVHGIYIAPYTSSQDRILRFYWASLLPFGAILAGALYFLTMAARRNQTLRSALLSGLCALAAIQLITEVLRGLWAYPYWFQDVRLIVIVATSALFGLGLASFVILSFMPKQRKVLIAAAAGLTLLALILPSGMDSKAGFALLNTTLFAAGIALSRVREMPKTALAFAACLGGFAALNVFAPEQFLDRYFYYAVAVLLLFLFSQQAQAFTREARLRRSQEARADRLQFVIDRLEQDSDNATLNVVDAGRTYRIARKDILFFRGAGDYVEVVLVSGETHLHTATLSKLETELPNSFLRVHRSFLVNTDHIRSLRRDPGGTGELSLSQGQTIPVSRRIMPRVKAAMT